MATNKTPLKITLWHDSDTDSPLAYQDTVNIVYTSSRYKLGTERVTDLAEYAMDLLCYGDAYRWSMYKQHGDSEVLLLTLIDRLNNKGYVAAPVYSYIHSGVAMRTSPFNCRWDSGLSGFIYAKRSDYLRERGKQPKTPRATALEMLAANVKTFGQWVNGETYGYTIHNAVTDEPIDSLCGIIGFDNIATVASDYVNAAALGYTKDEIEALFEAAEFEATEIE